MQVTVDHSSMSNNRIEEIRAFAKGAGFKKIGIAHCVMFPQETEIVKKYLSKDFEVFTVDCKYGRIRKDEMLGGNGRRIMCNPAGQADFLNNQKTDLNISLALCVGHDMIFSKASDALVTNLFDKDFTNDNNPAQAVVDIEQQL
jgi:uncharacterized metal-binding protein